MPTVISSPPTFVYHGDGSAGPYVVLLFSVPAGAWVSARWARTYSRPLAEAAQHGVYTSTGAHGALFPLGPSSGVGPSMDGVAASSDQLVDINAAAGGDLTAWYHTSAADPLVESFSSLTLELIGGGMAPPTQVFERATVYEGVQFGVESVQGTAVAANKRLTGVEFDFDHMTDIKPYRPQGNKFNTASQRGKEMTSGRLTGIQSFNDMLYLAASWLAYPTITTPANNSKWNVSGASGTWGFTFKGATLAPATYASAAAAQAAIEGMASVGTGNVLVTGAAPTFAIQFRGALSTDTSAITSPTGSAAPTITLDTAATLTRRFKFVMAPYGPDTVQTYTFEKGAAGVANMAQQIPFGFVGGLAVKTTAKEASINGEVMGQMTVDPFTMTASPVDVAQVPVDPATANVWMGTSLTAMSKMKRILELEFGVSNRANGLMTLNADDPSFSNRIEGSPDLTTRFFQEHDSDGQTMLARLRANTPVFVVYECVGPAIETGFAYRMKWTYKTLLVKPNVGDVDGAYGLNYDGALEYDSGLGTAIQLEIDTPLTGL